MDHLTFLVLFSFFQIISGTTQPTVTLKDGTVLRGVNEELHNDLLPVHANIESFYGIPYAEAPVGPLRFKPPVPKKQLVSPFDASQIGSSCMQPDPEITLIPLTNEVYSEDCLFVNVKVPRTTLTGKGHVFVSIHGGSFTFGAGEMPFGNFLTTVAYGNIILVTFNYRVGPFGFLTTDDGLIPGNLGLIDQQLALKWVNENIEAFGGDPNKVTIGGVSAGSASVGFHALSPGSKGLFRYGIMESGSPFDPWLTYRQGEEARLEVRTLAKLLGCTPEDIGDDVKLLECLIKAHADGFIENIAMVTELGEKLGGSFLRPPGPNIDGHFLPKDTFSNFEKGVLNGESYIVGTNAEEGNLFPAILFPDKEVKPVINSTMLPIALASLTGVPHDSIVQELIKTMYTADPNDVVDDKQEDFFHELTQYLTDLMYTCGSSKFSKLASQTKSVYRCTMTFVPSNNFLGYKWAGAAHGDEAQYVVGEPFQEKYLNLTTDEERVLSRKTMQYWINFIKTGDPNIAGDENNWSLPAWPKFTKEDQIFKDLTPDMGNRYMKRRECYFIENVLSPLKDALKELESLKKSADERTKWTTESQCEGETCHKDKGMP